MNNNDISEKDLASQIFVSLIEIHEQYNLTFKKSPTKTNEELATEAIEKAKIFEQVYQANIGQRIGQFRPPHLS